MSKEKLQLTGVLLTGGESRRMGRNKAFLEIGGKPLLERSLEVLNNVCSEVLISSKETDLYEGYGYKVIPDIIKGKGPLGGLFSVLQQANYEHLFLVACDMPLLNEKAIAYTYRELGEYDAVVPYVLGRSHPLHACYHQRILPLVEEKIQEDKLRLTELLSECRTKIVKLDSGIKDSDERELLEQSFLNVNTPEEWETIDKFLNK